VVVALRDVNKTLNDVYTAKHVMAAVRVQQYNQRIIPIAPPSQGSVQGQTNKAIPVQPEAQSVGVQLLAQGAQTIQNFGANLFFNTEAAPAVAPPVEEDVDSDESAAPSTALESEIP